MSSIPGRIGVLFGGPSPEHDVSILTGLQAALALEPSVGGRAASLHALYWSKGGEFFEVDPRLEAKAFLEGTPSGATPAQLVVGPGGGFSVRRGRIAAKFEPLELDALLNCCHGGPGEDGALQGALDLAGVAYSGPSASGAALGMDKLAFSGVVEAAGMSCLSRELLSGDGAGPAFVGPYIVKPRFGGSSIGIEVVEDLATARAQLGASVHFRRGAVIEPYRPDLTDLQVAIRTFPETELSAIERPIRTRPGGEILGYLDKYVGGEGMVSAPRELPASINPELEARVRATALQIGRLVEVRGVARIDFLSDGEELYVNEINTIPGSLSRHLFVSPELPFATLLADLLAEARERPAARLGSAGADGLVLRDAGAISAKLG